MLKPRASIKNRTLPYNVGLYQQVSGGLRCVEPLDTKIFADLYASVIKG